METIEKYRLCRLRKGARWYVEFYQFNPGTNQLDRVRQFISSKLSAKEKTKLSNELIATINKRLVDSYGLDSLPTQYARTTIIEAMELVLKLKSVSAERRTIDTYKSRVTIFKKWIYRESLHQTYICEFTKKMAIHYMDSIRLQGLSNRTYNGYLTDMRTFFNALVERELIAKNPFKEIKMLKLSDKLRNSFTTAQIAQLTDYLSQHNKAFLAVCYYCYYAILRPVEICRLKVSDLNFETKTIQVRSEVSKNDKHNTIPMMQDLYDLLLQLQIDKAPKNYYLVSWGFVPGPDKMRENEIARYFKKIAGVLAFPTGTTFYSLKDTVAERLITAGFDIKFIQRLFRHSDITVTDAYISKFNPTLDSRLLDKFPSI